MRDPPAPSGLPAKWTVMWSQRLFATERDVARKDILIVHKHRYVSLSESTSRWKRLSQYRYRVFQEFLEIFGVLKNHITCKPEIFFWGEVTQGASRETGRRITAPIMLENVCYSFILIVMAERCPTVPSVDLFFGFLTQRAQNSARFKTSILSTCQTFHTGSPLGRRCQQTEITPYERRRLLSCGAELSHAISHFFIQRPGPQDQQHWYSQQFQHLRVYFS